MGVSVTSINIGPPHTNASRGPPTGYIPEKVTFPFLPNAFQVFLYGGDAFSWSRTPIAFLLVQVQ